MSVVSDLTPHVLSLVICIGYCLTGFAIVSTLIDSGISAVINSVFVSQYCHLLTDTTSMFANRSQLTCAEVRPTAVEVVVNRLGVAKRAQHLRHFCG